MPSTFFGLTIGTSGLNAAHVSINTTAHNISNVETPGYTRQQASQTAGVPLRVNTTYGMIGSGVSVNSIEQIRDPYYDVKYWNNNNTLGEYTTKNHYMDQIQDLYYNETDGVGFTTYYGKLCNALDALSSTPADSATRNSAIQNAQALSDYYNNISQNLKTWQEECNQQLNIIVSNINTYASNIAALNKQIAILESNQGFANDLRDQRNLLVDELSSFVGVTVEDKKSPTGTSCYTVRINGEILVDEYDYRSLKVEEKTEAQKRHSTDVTGLYTISWSDGSSFNEYSAKIGGALEGYIAIRDGDNLETPEYPKRAHGYDYKGIPYYMEQTNDFTQEYTRQFNMIHMQGVNLKGESTRYTPFFTLKDKSLEEIQSTSNTAMQIFGELAGKVPGADGTISLSDGELANIYNAITGETKAPGDVNAADVQEKLSKWAYDNLGYAPERDGDPAVFVKNWVEDNASKYAMEQDSGLLQDTIDDAKKNNQMDSYLIDYAFAKGTDGSFLDEKGEIKYKKIGNAYYAVDLTTSSGYADDPTFIRDNAGILCKAKDDGTGNYIAGDKVTYGEMENAGAVYGSMPMVDYIATNMTADKMCVNPDIINKNELMATATEVDNGIDKPDVVSEMNALRYDKFMENGTAEDFMRGLVSSSSIDAYNASSMETHSTNISKTIINQRLSISGVDKDEEAVSLVKYQQAYELSAKVISIMSQMYDKLINGMAV